jgi:outer membrane receptor protein involved in Fe transport
MARNLRYLFLLLFIAVSGTAFSQNSGITGTVVDDRGEAVIGAVVSVSQGGISKNGAPTDVDGKYLVKPLNAGRYDVRISYPGFKENLVTNVLVSPDKLTEVSVKMEVNKSTILTETVVKAYKVPLVDKHSGGGSTTLTAAQLEKLPTRGTSDQASLASGAYQSRNGAAISLGGARTNGTLYIIDGVQVNGVSGTNLPPKSVEQMTVSSSAISAKYGDATGGVINITTKGSTPTTQGGIQFEHSVDGYNHNLASFNLSGPLLKKKDSKGERRPILGYSLSGQYLYDEDNNPTYYDNTVLKSDVLESIRQKPLVATTNSNGAPVYRSATEFVTADDFETRKKRINADYTNARVNGKLDFQVSENLNIVAGGNYSKVRAKAYSRGYSLFSPEAIPIDNLHTGRAFIRLTQKFAKNDVVGEEGKPVKNPLISNAYYSLQADYQVDYSRREDPNHKTDPFKYGYVGKFNANYIPVYGVGTDTASKILGVRLLTYDYPTGITFDRSEMNPLLANYTSQYYDLAGDQIPLTMATIQQGGGLRNGDAPATTYGLWTNVGNSFTGFSYGQTDQVAVSVDAGFDLQPKKTRHQIEFGLYYQQRAERSYSVGGAALWNLMRLSANRHLLDLDFSDPIFVINGQHYTLADVKAGLANPGPTDTILYNREVNFQEQTFFDENLRKKLGLNPQGQDYINIDALDPSTFSLDMFAPDELINSGNPIVSGYGYDYSGKRLNGQVNFNDWFTKKDASGNYTRQVGAFRPNYIAGYIQDRFELKDINFSLGVRVERFDANTKVLKDPYSLYATHTVATSNAVNTLNDGKTPDNIGSNYVVYVTDNASSSPQVIGYRDGDDWYDPFGKIVADPTLLKTYSGGRDPQPYLQLTGDGRALTMSDSGYNPNTSFTDYKPQVNVMPRLSFTFPIGEGDKSMFYAHYDVLVQRPKSAGEMYASPADYYFLNQNSNSVIPNPDLKPEKLFDYEFGFQQALTSNSAISITGFYKERKDMIQVRPYLYAWPNTYFTFGNRDFSTTKGLKLSYDLRRMGPIQLLLNYTLQFAEGTGSSSSDANGGNGSSVAQAGLLQSLISAQLPNFRFTYPLNVDSRHNIVLNLDYRYGYGEGPKVNGSAILENAGLNLVFKTRSGEPYTKYDQPQTQIVEGGVQQSRLPWHYMLDLNVDKTFALNFHKKKEDGTRKESRLSLNAFVYITNVLNTRDVLAVDGYTGRPDDDGYLASPQGQATVNLQTNKESYIDMYRLSTQGLGALNNPRQVNVGLALEF